MAQQKVRIDIPSDIDAFGRQFIGEQIVDFIQDRTGNGKGINNKPFTRYSSSYVESDDFKDAGKSGTVNLEQTGDMMSDLSVLSHTVGSILIGYKDGTPENERAEWLISPERNDKTGHTNPRRDFLGIAQKDLDNIINEFRKRNPVEVDVESTASKEARSILNRLFRLSNG